MKNFNVTGDRRKALVKALEEVLGLKSRYCGMPSCAYQIGDLTVNKDGTVAGEFSDEMLRLLSECGFIAEAQEKKKTEPVTFDSDAKEIQHYAKLILANGQACSAKNLKAEISKAAGREFSVGAFAGAFRELVETDCRYSAEERGSYRYTEFDGDADLLPFISAIVSMKSKLVRLREKMHIPNQVTSDRISHAIQTADTLISALWKNE